MIFQYRRLKQYSNEKNLIEVAYLVEWREPHGKNPILDELQDFNSVQWKAIGFLTLTDDEWSKMRIDLQFQVDCYFTDDVRKEASSGN